MQKFKKHISIVLLLIFGWLLLPDSLLHSAFANHDDTDDDTECHLLHRQLGTHFEKQHTHCGIFNANTPLYDSPKLAPVIKALAASLSISYPRLQSSYHHLRALHLPSRAPPTA